MVLIAISILITVLMIAASSWALSIRHNSSRNSASTNSDDYYAQRKKRDRFFREEHLAAAMVTGLSVGALQNWWTGSSIIPAAIALASLFATWLVLTHKLRPPKGQLFLWGNQDMTNFGRSIALALCVGMIACVVLGSGALTLAVACGVFGVTWLLLFPL